VFKIRCEKCGFEDKPENFTLFAELDKESSIMLFYIQCPACDHLEFLQHLTVECVSGLINEKYAKCVSMSHLFKVSIEECEDPELAYNLMLKKIREFKRKYGRNSVVH